MFSEFYNFYLSMFEGSPESFNILNFGLDSGLFTWSVSSVSVSTTFALVCTLITFGLLLSFVYFLIRYFFSFFSNFIRS